MIRPWRRLVQGLGALLFFALPHLGWQGESLLRLDIPSWTLFVAGGQLRLEEFYLLGLFLLALLFFFLLLTMTLGRLWCGWFCPQTWLNNLVEGVARRLGLGVDPWKISGPRGRTLALHLFYAALALWCGATVVWYFVAPEVYWQRLVAGDPGPWSLGFTLGLATLFFLAGQRQPVSLQVARLVTAQPMVGEDGMLSHRFRAQVANRTGEDAEYRLVARLVNGDQLSPGSAPLVLSPYLDGPGVVSPGPAAVAPPLPGEIPVLGQGADFFPLAPGERRRLLFAVTLPPAGQGETHHLAFALVDRRGREQAKIDIAW